MNASAKIINTLFYHCQNTSTRGAKIRIRLRVFMFGNGGIVYLMHSRLCVLCFTVVPPPATSTFSGTVTLIPEQQLSSHEITRDYQPTLVWCQPTVYDTGPTSNQHWINPFKPDFTLSSSSTTSRELLSQFSTCSAWRWFWSWWKINEYCHVLINQFHGNFQSKTPSCRRIKYDFRDVKWCFNASWGLKVLTYCVSGAVSLI